LARLLPHSLQWKACKGCFGGRVCLLIWERNHHPASQRADAEVLRPANRQLSGNFPKGLGWVREVSIVKGKSAVIAKVLFELRAEIRDGPANAACPAVLNTELLPHGGLAKVWIFGVQFGLRPRGEAHSLGPVEVSASRNERAGTAIMLFEPRRHSPGLGLPFSYCWRRAAGTSSPVFSCLAGRFFRVIGSPHLNTGG